MDPMDLFKNLQNLQSQMSSMQEKIKEIVVHGSSGGGMVELSLNGDMQVLSVKIAPEVVDPEDITMLEDLILAAMNSALSKLKEEMAGKASSLAGTGFPGL